MIIDVRFWYSDLETWNTEIMENILPPWVKLKEDKHGQHFHDQRKHFSLFFLSVDRMMEKEAQVVLANLSLLMTAEIYEPIFYTEGWVNRRIAIAVVRL